MTVLVLSVRERDGLTLEVFCWDQLSFSMRRKTSKFEVLPVPFLASSQPFGGSIIRFSSNPDPLDFPDADVVVAPVVKAGGFRVRVPGHALRDLDTAAIGEVVRNPCGAEGMATYRGFN